MPDSEIHKKGTKKQSSNAGDEISEAFRQVPAIGEGSRWYDYLYRFLGWIGSSQHRKFLPKSVFNLIWEKINDLTPYNEYDRYISLPLDSINHSFKVPENTHVRVIGIWVIELFPPSYFNKLFHSMETHGWRKRESRELGGTDNGGMVEAARSNNSEKWWHLGTSVSPNFRGVISDGTTEDIPEEFSYIKLDAIQVGSGLTAVAAFFSLTSNSMQVLDKEWHSQHTPMLVKEHRRKPRAYDRAQSGVLKTQEKRAELQNSARKWLSEKCPGFFASNGAHHPAIDIMFFIDEPINMDLVQSTTYRALGLAGTEHITSPDMPGFIFIPDNSEVDESRLHNCIALVRNKKDAENVSKSYIYDNSIEYYLLIYSLNQYSEIMTASSASKRDAIAKNFSKHRVSTVSKLRKSVLTDSLDIAEMQNCYELPWSESWRIWPGIKLEGRIYPTNLYYDYSSALRENITNNFAYISIEDTIYRDLLSTASSLGSSSSSLRLGRIALVVSLVSLLVAILSLLISNIPTTTYW